MFIKRWKNVGVSFVNTLTKWLIIGLATTPPRKTVIAALNHQLIFKNRNSKYVIHIKGTPTMADGIPIPTNQLSTGVIFSRRNKKGITKIINEHKANGMP
ncbi:MAG: hypothetical protein FWG14_14365, partial [Peptococcaceae bacterium]|nr:hypothetical protein [Peptococcaceae bacterium]